MSAGLLRVSRLALLSSLALQAYALFFSSAGSGVTITFPHADKLVHAAIFALPAFLGVLCRLSPWLFGIVLGVYAPVSEFIQHRWLSRHGDPWDVLADWVGVALGLVAGVFVAARVHSHKPPTVN